jgi:hypothetical protein
MKQPNTKYMQKNVLHKLFVFICVWLIMSTSFISAFALSINNVQVTPTTTSASITFTTDAQANTGIEYIHQSTNRESLIGFNAVQHGTTLAGLLPNTEYPFTIWARQNGTEITYNGTFKTLQKSGSAITGVSTGASNQSGQQTQQNQTMQNTSGVGSTTSTTSSSGSSTIAVVAQPFTVQVDESIIPRLSTRADVTIKGSMTNTANVTAYAVYDKTGGEYDSGSRVIQAGEFSISVPLDDGNNKVLVVFVDIYGQKYEFYREIFVDSEPVRILEHNLAQLSPAYTSVVEITGRVNKPNIDVRLYVNPKQLRFSCSRGLDTNGSGLTVGTTTANPCNDTDTYISVRSDANGYFKKEISLFGVAGSLFSGLGVANIPNIETTATSNISNTFLDNQQAVGGAFSTIGEHKVRIVAIDRVGQHDSAEGVIVQAACGRGSGDWIMTLGDMYPAAIQPDHVFNGIAQISFAAKLDYIGTEGKESVEVAQASVRPQVRSQWDQTQLSPQELITSSSCRVYPPSGIYDQIYVVCNLASWPPERFRNMTRAYEMLEEYERLTFPLQLEFSYSYLDRAGQTTSRFHKECLDVTVLVDKRLSPDKIPKSLLNGSVTLLDDAIKSIDSMLGPLNTIKTYTTFACFGSTGLSFFQGIGEASACFSVGRGQDERIEGFLRGLPESDTTAINTYCENNFGANNKQNDCLTCAAAISNRLASEKTNQLLCDRIFCPAIPSRAEYIKQMTESNAQNSACLSVDQQQGSQIGNYWYQSTLSLNSEVTYSPNGPVPNGFSREFGCGKEYNDKWSSACLFGFDAFEETVRIEDPKQNQNNANSGASFFNNLGICKHSDSENGPDFFRANGQVYCKSGSDPTSTCYTLCNDLSTGDFTRTSTGARTGVVDQNTLNQQVTPATTGLSSQLTSFGVLNCVETSVENGALIYTFKDSRDATKPLVYDPMRAKSIPLAITTNTNAPQNVMITEFTTIGKDNQPLQGGIDAQGNYYKQTTNGQWERATSANNGDGFFKYVSVDSAGSSSSGFDFVGGQPQAGTGTLNQPNAYGVYADQPQQGNPINAVRGPENLRPNQTPQIIKDPTSSFTNALQCGCLPAIEGYLIVIRNVLSAIRNCFNSILVTGEFNSGICRAVLTQYLCDWIWEALKCAWNAADRTQSQQGDTQRQGGLLSSLGSMGAASKKISTSMQQRYGGTASFNALINQRKLLHSVCLAAFGYDWLPELDMATSIQGTGFSINTTAVIQPANRRFVSTNPTSGGEVTYIYHVGYFVAAGSQLTYRLELICSADNSCDPSDGFEGGRCDCSHPGSRGEEVLVLDSGVVGGGRTVGGGEDQLGRPLNNANINSNGQGDLYRSVTAPIRYDTVRLSWVDRSGGGNSGEVVRRISETGGATPRTCFFNTIALRFACDFAASNRNGDVYFVGDNPIQLSQSRYNLGDRFGISVNARQDFTGIESKNQVSKFAQLQILKDGAVLATEFTVHDALAFPPIAMGSKIQLGTPGGVGGSGFMLGGMESFAGLNQFPISTGALDTPRATEPQRQYYLYVSNTSELGKFLKSKGVRDDAGKVCAFAREGITPGTLVAKTQADLDRMTFSSCSMQVSGETVRLMVSSSSEFLQFYPTQGETAQQLLTRLQSQDIASVLLITRAAATTSQSQTLCTDPTVTTEQLIARVTLHHGRLLDTARGALTSNVVPERSIATYNGAPQSREIRFSVNCQPQTAATSSG